MLLNKSVLMSSRCLGFLSVGEFTSEYLLKSATTCKQEVSLSISDDIARFSDVCLRPFQVCWCCLLITVEAIGNLDHDQSSTTAQGLLNGSWIGFFQFPKQASDVSQPTVQRVNFCSFTSVQEISHCLTRIPQSFLFL